MVILGGNKNYLSAQDAKDGEMIEFLNEGEWIENTRYKYDDGNPKVDFVVSIRYEGEKKSFRVNKTNRDCLSLAWGNDTAAWVGKKAKITKENILAGGKRMKTIILEPEGGMPPVTDTAWDE